MHAGDADERADVVAAVGAEVAVASSAASAAIGGRAQSTCRRYGHNNNDGDDVDAASVTTQAGGGAAAATSGAATAKASRKGAEKAEQQRAREQRDQARSVHLCRAHLLLRNAIAFSASKRGRDVRFSHCNECWRITGRRAPLHRPTCRTTGLVLRPTRVMFAFLLSLVGFIFHLLLFVCDRAEIMQRADIKFKTPQQLET